MKKYLTMALTTLLVAVTAVCFAANGKILEAEEAIAEQYAYGGFYKKVVPFMTANLQAELTEAKYVEMQKQLAQGFGKFTLFKMRQYTRADDYDVLLYQVSAEKIPTARYQFFFKVIGDKPFLEDAIIELPNPKKAEEPKK